MVPQPAVSCFKVIKSLKKSTEAILGGMLQIALPGWTPESLCLVILDSELNRFTPFWSMHKHIEAFVSIKAQDEQYCKYMFPWGYEPIWSMQEHCTSSKDLILQEHYSRLTREGTDLYTVRYGKKNTPDKSMSLSGFDM